MLEGKSNKVDCKLKQSTLLLLVKS